MRIVYFGSGEFGLPTLTALCGGHDVCAVVTQPDRPAGRKTRLTPTPVAQWAEAAGRAVLKPEDANDPGFVETIRQLNADAAVVIAFGQKLSEALIAAAGAAAFNLHASLLPRLRGAAPINWAVIRGEKQTGVSAISLAQRMDAGLIYDQAATPIDPAQTAGELHDRLAKLGPPLVGQVLDDLAAGTLEGTVQDESHVSRAPKLSRADGHVDFDAAAEQVRNRIHGLTPWPGVQVNWHCASTGRSQPLRLRRVQGEPGAAHDAAPGELVAPDCVAVGDGVVRLVEVQLPGGRALAIAEFANGHPIGKGDRFERL